MQLVGIAVQFAMMDKSPAVEYFKETGHHVQKFDGNSFFVREASISIEDIVHENLNGMVEGFGVEEIVVPLLPPFYFSNIIENHL